MTHLPHATSCYCLIMKLLYKDIIEILGYHWTIYIHNRRRFYYNRIVFYATIIQFIFIYICVCECIPIYVLYYNLHTLSFKYVIYYYTMLYTWCTWVSRHVCCICMHVTMHIGYNIVHHEACGGQTSVAVTRCV